MNSATFVFSLLLLCLAFGMTAAHRQARRLENARLQADSRAARFSKKKFKRRMRISAMLGIAAIAIFISPWLPSDALFFGWYWLVVTSWVLWILLLALWDLFATRRYLGCLQHDQWLEQVKLQAKPERIKREENMGPPRNSPDNHDWTNHGPLMGG